MGRLTNLSDRFNDICFTLSREHILAMNQSTNTGNVNNVISRISRHCFGIQSIDDAPIRLKCFTLIMTTN